MIPDSSDEASIHTAVLPMSICIPPVDMYDDAVHIKQQLGTHCTAYTTHLTCHISVRNKHLLSFHTDFQGVWRLAKMTSVQV